MEDLLGLIVENSRETDKALLAKRGKKKTFISGGLQNDKMTHLKLSTARVKQHLSKYENDFVLITEKKDLDSFVSKVIKQGIFSFDTETDCDWDIDSGSYCLDATIVGFSIYTPGSKAIYVPLNHVSFMTGNPLPNNLSMADAKSALSRIFGAGDKPKCIMHNAKFDLRIARHCLGLEVYPFFDTQIAMHLLNENEETGLKQSFDRLLATDFEKGVHKFTDFFGERDFKYILPDVGRLYAARDAYLTFKLYEYAKAELDKKENEGVRTVFNKIEMPLIRVVAGMEDEGIKVDEARNKELTILYQNKMDLALEKIKISVKRFDRELDTWHIKNGKARVEFNPGSTQQLAVIVYDILGLKNKINKKERSTEEDVLQSFLNEDELFPLILDYRGYKKVLGTYLENIDKTRNKKTGHVHCSFKQTGTVTGRFSSAGPNMQNIPKRGEGVIIRTQYVPDEGCNFLSADYSQQEPRILAYLSGDPALIKAYEDKKDLYMVMGAKISGKPYELCGEKFTDGKPNKDGLILRTKMKGVTLAIMYGEEDKALGESLGISTKEAAKFRQDFYKAFPLVKKLIDDTHAFASEHGYVETCAGRRRRLPILLNPDFEVSYVEGMAADFDPLNFDAEQKTTEVPKNIANKWISRLEGAYGFDRKMAIKEEAKNAGIILKEWKNLKGKAYRQSVNTLMQGSAGDMIKLAMIELDKNEEFKKLGGRLKLQVHDELVVQVKKDKNLVRQKEIMTDCMLRAADMLIDVPMKVDVDTFKYGWDGEKI